MIFVHKEHAHIIAHYNSTLERKRQGQHRKNLGHPSARARFLELVIAKRVQELQPRSMHLINLQSRFILLRTSATARRRGWSIVLFLLFKSPEKNFGGRDNGWVKYHMTNARR